MLCSYIINLQQKIHFLTAENFPQFDGKSLKVLIDLAILAFSVFDFVAVCNFALLLTVCVVA